MQALKAIAQPFHHFNQIALVRRSLIAAERRGLQPRAPSTAAPREPASNCMYLPLAAVRAAVHVQHLPGDLARFGEIDHRACDLL